MNHLPAPQWNSHPPYKDACLVTDDHSALARHYPLSEYPWTVAPLMGLDAYEAIIDQLVKTNPEDLVNIISRVLAARADVTHSSDSTITNCVESGRFVMSACPGLVDCPREAPHNGHPDEPDREFTLTLSSGWNGLPPINTPADANAWARDLV